MRLSAYEAGKPQHYDFIVDLTSQGKDMGKGSSDGSHNYKNFFSCPQHCGIFVPFSQIIPVAQSSSPPPTAEAYAHPNSEELFVGDRVTYFTTNKLRHGMVMDIQEKDGETMVRISTVSSFPSNNPNRRAKRKWKLCRRQCQASTVTLCLACLSRLFAGHG